MTETIVDQQFPQIARALSGEYMRTFLQVRWLTKTGADSNLLIEKCEVGEKRYKPGKDFQLSYRLTIFDRFARQQQDHVISARLLPRSQQADFVNLQEVSFDTSNGLPSVCYAAELGMMIWTFPHDPKLINLPRLHNRSLLPEYFNNHPDYAGLAPKETVQAVDTQVLHFLPEKSCMTQYRLTIADVQTGATEREVCVFGKTYCDDSGRRTFAIMQQLAEQNPYCAKVLGYDDRLKVLWQTQMHGAPLEWHADIAKSTGLFVNLGRCVAALHSSKVNIEETYGFTQIFKQLDAACALVENKDKHLAGRVTALRASLHSAHELIDWAAARRSPLHMDLKMGNLLVDGGSVALIDMDGICLGDPLIDIGSFIANVYLNGLRAGAGANVIAGFVDRFVESYAHCAGWRIDQAQLSWYISAALIHEVLRRSIRQQDAARLQLSETVVKVGEQYLAQTFDYLPALKPCLSQG